MMVFLKSLDATAESLSNFQGTTLYLNGLTQLSFSSKMSFSKYRGYLYVKGLGEKIFTLLTQIGFVIVLVIAHLAFTPKIH